MCLQRLYRELTYFDMCCSNSFFVHFKKMYFKGEWIPVVGPLTREDYDSNRKQIPESIHTHIGAGVLCKCSYQLTFKHENFNGDLYLSNQTGRLYIASAVEQVLVSSSLYGGDLMSSSLGSDKLDEFSM